MSRRDLELLLRLQRMGHIQKTTRVIELGAQQLSRNALESRDLIIELGRAVGAKGDPELPFLETPSKLDLREVPLDPAAPMSRIMWTWMGLPYAAIDIDDSPDSIPLDLNFDDVPGRHKNRYDLVTNYGTTEHVANQMNAFKIAHDLTTVGGVMVHHLPSQGNFNHGLVNYPPKFFWMLARSNDYRWLYFDYTISDEIHPVPANLMETVIEFEPDIAERMKGKVFQNSALVVALQKRRDTPYVPPIDVPARTVTKNKALLKRYPTVFRAG